MVDGEIALHGPQLVVLEGGSDPLSAHALAGGSQGAVSSLKVVAARDV